MTADLERFVAAQDGPGPGGRSTYDAALAELRAGRKQSHWMWFVLPQLAGLGRSETARRYALADLEEARAYLAHPVLGPRLAACAQALLALPEGTTARAVLGDVDAQKLCSSMTVLGRAAPDDPLPGQVLARYCGGREDTATLELLRTA